MNKRTGSLNCSTYASDAIFDLFCIHVRALYRVPINSNFFTLVIVAILLNSECEQSTMLT